MQKKSAAGHIFMRHLGQDNFGEPFSFDETKTNTTVAISIFPSQSDFYISNCAASVKQKRIGSR